MLVELLELAALVTRCYEFDFAFFVVLAAFGGRDDFELGPVVLEDRFVEGFGETGLTGVGVDGVHEVGDVAEEVGTITSTGEGLGGGGVGVAVVVGHTAGGVAKTALAGAEGFFAFARDFFAVFVHMLVVLLVGGLLLSVFF